MLTLIGMRKLKRLLIKLVHKGDHEWNEILQVAVIGINRLMDSRYGDR